MTATHAGVTIVGTQNSSSPIPFSEAGTFVAAGNFGGVTDTRGTNVFQSEMLSNSASPQAFNAGSGLNVAVASSNSGTLAYADLGSTTDDIYLTEIYAPNQATLTWSITGLNPSLIYLIQFPHGENRSYLYQGTQTFNDSSNNSATSALTFGNSLGKQFALVDVQVSNSTGLTYQMPPGDRGPSFDGWSVRIVPEPKASALVGVCVGVVFIRARRRRQLGVLTDRGILRQRH